MQSPSEAAGTQYLTELVLSLIDSVGLEAVTGAFNILTQHINHPHHQDQTDML